MKTTTCSHHTRAVFYLWAIVAAFAVCVWSQEKPPSKKSEKAESSSLKQNLPSRFHHLKFEQRIGFFLDEIPVSVIGQIKPGSKELLTGIAVNTLPDTEASKKFKAAIWDPNGSAFLRIILQRDGGKMVHVYKDVTMDINGDLVEMYDGKKLVKSGKRSDFKSLIRFDSIAASLIGYKKTDVQWGDLPCVQLAPTENAKYPRLAVVLYHEPSKVVVRYTEENAPSTEQSVGYGFSFTAQSDLSHD